ncbi:hypothetical protein [uncultured Fretibacterium sp.]|uniref:hypothetical protein n=1 Tax=uncultured Fretibacterium sp. TaxID=1678694 RepID=UPI002609416D|nr:hypothetical protein [uncultured Fretibacterium sp.]
MDLSIRARTVLAVPDFSLFDDSFSEWLSERCFPLPEKDTVSASLRAVRALNFGLPHAVAPVCPKDAILEKKFLNPLTCPLTCIDIVTCPHSSEVNGFLLFLVIIL